MKLRLVLLSGFLLASASAASAYAWDQPTAVAESPKLPDKGKPKEPKKPKKPPKPETCQATSTAVLAWDVAQQPWDVAWDAKLSSPATAAKPWDVRWDVVADNDPPPKGSPQPCPEPKPPAEPKPPVQPCPQLV